MPDPKWESVVGRIDSHDNGSKTITLEIQPEGHVVGYRIEVAPINVPYIGRVLDRMVKRIDKALGGSR